MFVASTHVRRSALVLVLAALTLGTTASAALAPEMMASPEAVNTDKTGIAIGGYDPVAYFTLGKPTKGNFTIASTYHGATYWFANEEHKKLFDATPEKYVPQFGGYCAFGVSIAKKLNGDPMVWKIVDGKLYLNVNPTIAEKFNENPKAVVATAETKWDAIKEKPAAEVNK